MIVRKSLFIILMLAVNATNAQQVLAPVGAEAWGLAGSSVAVPNVWAVLNNPAAFSEVKKVQAGIGSEQRFLESRMSAASLCAVVPFKWTSVGIGIHHFGYTAFNQQRFSLALSRQLFRQFSIGATLSYLGTNISEQGHAGNLVGEAGMMYKASSKINLGIFLFNLTQSTWSVNTRERIPTYARIGASYAISDKIMLVSEAEQVLQQKLTLRGGVRYRIHEKLSLSAGAANNPVYFTFGAGFQHRQLKIDFAASIHEVLGVTPHLSLAFPVDR